MLTDPGEKSGTPAKLYFKKEKGKKKKKKQKAQAGNEWSNILPKSSDARKKITINISPSILGRDLLLVYEDAVRCILPGLVNGKRC